MVELKLAIKENNILEEFSEKLADMLSTASYLGKKTIKIIKNRGYSSSSGNELPRNFVKNNLPPRHLNVEYLEKQYKEMFTFRELERLHYGERANSGELVDFLVSNYTTWYKELVVASGYLHVRSPVRKILEESGNYCHGHPALALRGMSPGYVEVLILSHGNNLNKKKWFIMFSRMGLRYLMRLKK